MTDRWAKVGDNGGRCDGCNDPETVHTVQFAYPVFLGGGIGQGSMWLCPACVTKRKTRETEAREAKQ